MIMVLTIIGYFFLRFKDNDDDDSLGNSNSNDIDDNNDNYQTIKMIKVMTRMVV